MWPFLVAQLGVTCWQICVIAFLPLLDGAASPEVQRTLAIRWWLPGEVLLTAVTFCAVLEVLWRSLKNFPVANKVGVLISTASACVFSASCAKLIGLPQFSDWFLQLRSDRLAGNVCIAALALCSFGIACTFNRRNDPRFVRMHAFLIAVLALSHVLFGGFGSWGAHHALYRQAEVSCLIGWVFNASLLRREMLCYHVADVDTRQCDPGCALSTRLAWRLGLAVGRSVPLPKRCAPEGRSGDPAAAILMGSVSSSRPASR